MTNLLRPIVALVAGACLLSCRCAAEPIPFRAFLTPAVYSQPKLSPDGTRLAMLVHLDFREQVVLIDLKTMQPTQIGLVDDNGSLENYWWKGDDTLLLLVGNGYQASFRTLDVHTKKANALNSLNNRGGSLVHILPSEPDSVLVSIFFGSGYGADLRRMNVRTGKMAIIEKGRLGVIRWLANNRGEAIAAFGREDENWFLLTRKSPGKDWVRMPLGSGYRPDFLPVAVYQDQRRLVGWDFASGNTSQGVVFDQSTGTKELLFESPEVDLDALQSWGDDDTHLMAINYETDQPRRFFLDQAAAAVMEKINAALPHRINSVVNESKDGSMLVIHSQSDRTPGEYFLLNRSSEKISPLGACKADLPEAALSPSRFFRFTARDGLALSGRVILPVAATSKPPLILVIGHYINGPRARYKFNEEDQLLASRGYAVARINYRGVAGFGSSLIKAGDKQATTGMPDDLEEGVRWLMNQGWVDRRAAVLGYGPGGLLAVQLAGRPAVFSAWINFNSPMTFKRFRYEDIVLSENKSDDALAQLGGSSAAWDFWKSLDKTVLSVQVKMPAFHSYSFVGENRDMAEGYSKRSGLPFVSILDHDDSYNKKHYRDNFRQAALEQRVEIYTQLLDFLQKHLPVHNAKAVTDN